MKKPTKKTNLYQLEDNIPLTFNRFDTSLPEYQTMISMKLHQSFSFPTGKLNIINKCRNKLKESGPMRFMFRNVSKTPALGRIWRIEDGKKLITKRKK